MGQPIQLEWEPLVAMVRQAAEQQGCEVEGVELLVGVVGKRKCRITFKDAPFPIKLPIAAQQAADELAQIGITCRVEE